MPAKTPTKTPTKEGRPANSRPCPPSFDPNEQDHGTETPTPVKNKRGVAAVIKSNSDKVSPDKVAKPASMVPFRHSWMKKVNSKGIPFTDLQAVQNYNADGSEDGQKTPNSAEGKSKTVDFSPEVTVNGTPAAADGEEEVNPLKPSKDEEGDYESDSGELINPDGDRQEAYMNAQGEIGPFVVARAMNNVEKSKKKLKAEEGVVDPNGRQVGRKLVLWHRTYNLNSSKFCFGL